MKSSSSWLFIVIIISTLTSCSIGIPSEGDGRGAILFYLNQAQDGAGRKIKLIKFEKIDGRERVVGGYNAYEMLYRAKIEFLDKERIFRACEQKGNWLPQATGWGKEYNKGEIIDVDGTLIFIKSEKGWQVTKPVNPC